MDFRALWVPTTRSLRYKVHGSESFHLARSKSSYRALEVESRYWIPNEVFLPRYMCSKTQAWHAMNYYNRHHPPFRILHAYLISKIFIPKYTATY